MGKRTNPMMRILDRFNPDDDEMTFIASAEDHTPS